MDITRKHTKSHNENISKSLMGHVVTNSTRNKISQTLQGHIVTKETRKKLSTMGKYGKAIKVTNFHTRECMGIFMSQHDIVKKLKSVKGTNLSQGNIGSCLHGKRFQHGGYTYQFVPMEEYHKHNMEN